jgi:hypothetical protein
MPKKTPKKDYSNRRKQEFALMAKRVRMATGWGQYELAASVGGSQYFASHIQNLKQKRTRRTEKRVARLSFLYRAMLSGKVGKRTRFQRAVKLLPKRLSFDPKTIKDTWVKALEAQASRKGKKWSPIPEARKSRVRKRLKRPTSQARHEVQSSVPLPQKDKWELFKSLVHELLGISDYKRVATRHVAARTLH